MEDQNIYFEDEQQQKSAELTNLTARLHSIREDAENFIVSLVVSHGGKIGSAKNPIHFTVEYLGDTGVESGCIDSINSNGEIQMEDVEDKIALSSLMADPLIYFSEELESYCRKMDKSDSEG